MRNRPLVSLFGALILLAPAACAAGPLRDHVGAYEFQVLIDGAPARTFQAPSDHQGETWLLGQLGARYTLRVINRSGQRIEAVVSVDGRDVIDGRPGDFRSKRGYLVPAFGQVDIDGWRLSTVAAAAFRFSRVSDSYAARTGHGRDVGVIGVAVFPERWVPPPQPVYTPPMDMPMGEPCDGCSLPRAESAPRGPAPPRAPSAPSPAPAFESGKSASGTLAERAPTRRPGLGTEFGEAMNSWVQEVPFLRADPARPAALLGVRYNDRDGLLALGINVDGGDVCCSEIELRRTAEPFPVVDRRYAAPPPGWR